MSNGGVGFTAKLVGVFTSPRKAFESVVEGDLRKGAALVLLVAVLSAWAGIVYASKMDLSLMGLGSGSAGRFFGPGFQGATGIGQETIRSGLIYSTAIRNGLQAFSRWLVPSLLILLVAKIYMGEGSARRMLAMTGFAQSPLLAQQLLRMMDAYTIASPQLTSVIASRALGSGLAWTILNQALDVFTVFGIATVVLTAFAVSVNYGAAAKRAAIVAISSYLIYILLRTFVPIV
jgi:hypothetical protein